MVGYIITCYKAIRGDLSSLIHITLDCGDCRMLKRITPLAQSSVSLCSGQLVNNTIAFQV